MNHKLSADPASLILGILSLLIILLGCCCGFLVIISLILGIVGLIMANNSLAEFYQNSENYSIQSQKNVYAGKILSIIGIIVSGIMILIFAVFMFFFQQNFADIVKNKYYNYRNIEVDVQDSTKIIKKTDTMYHDKDSIYSDSVDASN